MKVFAVANQKGGVGKTTTSVTLAGLLSQHGHKTLVVDLDPHGSLTTYFRYDVERITPSVYDLFEQQLRSGHIGDVTSAIRRTSYKNLHLLPASTALATLDRQIGSRDGMGLVVLKSLDQISHLYDYVFIDCPPVLGIAMINALAASELLLIPVQTEFLAQKGLERMLQTLKMVVRAQKFPLQHLIVPTLFDQRTRAARDILQELRQRYGSSVWSSQVPVDNQFREASRLGVPLSIRVPHARGVEAYSELLDFILHRDVPFRQVMGQ